MPPKIATGLPPDAEASLSSLRVNLLHLNEAMVRLQNVLASPSDTMPDWPTLVSMYAALLSQAQGIATQLGTPPGAQQSKREMERHLARIVPHPVRPTALARDVEVATLVLNTAAPSMAEEADRRSILETLPPDLQCRNREDARYTSEALNRVHAAIEMHDRTAAFARRRVGIISDLERGDSEDEDEDAEDMDHAGDLPSYDWKLRLEVDRLENILPSQQQTALLQDWATVLREGR